MRPCGVFLEELTNYFLSSENYHIWIIETIVTMRSWKSTSSSKAPCGTGDALFLDEYADIKDMRSRQKSGTMLPPSSIATLESHCMESLRHSEQAKTSCNKVRLASTPPLSIQPARSFPTPTSQTFKKNIVPTFDHDDLDTTLDKDQWFHEGETPDMMNQRGPSVERGMLFPWMTDSEIV